MIDATFNSHATAHDGPSPAATVANEDSEARALSTSLDPYGQLVRMLMPRVSYVAIYDRLSTPLWLSDGQDGANLLDLVEESLISARSGGSGTDHDSRHGFSRSWSGDTAYVFILRDGATLLGALAISCQDGSSGARSFAFVHSLLRPVLQVLARELSHQYHLGELSRGELSRGDPRRADPRENPASTDGDLELLLDASGADQNDTDDDLRRLLQTCVTHLDCCLGVLLIPDRNISLLHSTEGSDSATDAAVLEQAQKHLLAWAQVQRRTLVLNKTPPNGPLAALPYKMLVCPIRSGVQHVAGVLLLLKRIGGADFTPRQVRILEILARRVAHAMQGIYDPATGLLTRSAFEQRAIAVLGESQSGAEHCVAYADVDRLHVVNENQGMHVGDAVIASIAETIRGSLAANVSAARISGDRFALFFAGTDAEHAAEFADRLCDTIGKMRLRHDDRTIELSISVGLAEVPNTRYPLSQALAAAEIACKAAKDRGRGRVETYREADRSIVRRYEDVTILGNLRDAIVNDRFQMEAQPIVPLGGIDRPRRFELLLRMIDTAGASVTPDKFLSAAERYQLSTDIDRWVVQYALEILSSAAPALTRLDAHFQINISGQSIGDHEFTRFLEERLREYALPPQLLSFEITETAAVANIVQAELMIRRLQDLGHAIALDDFGRGLSSLTYLKSLPVSHLKIDGRLVRDLVGNQRAQATVTAIVQLARAMNLRTTAECVETPAILAVVGPLGVDYAQGFAIGRPRPFEIVLQELLRDSGRRDSASWRAVLDPRRWRT